MVTSPPPSASRRRLPRSRITVTRAPVLIELSDDWIRVGLVGQASAQSATPLPPIETAQLSTAALYRRCSPLMQQALSLMSQDLSERKVLVVFHTGLYLMDRLREALIKVLGDAGLQAIRFAPALELIGHSLPLQNLLLIDIAGREAHCLAVVDGEPLPFTYQSVVAETAKPLTVGEHNAMLEAWLDPHVPSSLVSAVLKCLEACPMPARPAVAANLCVGGEVFDNNYSVRLARALRAALSDDEENVAPQPGAAYPHLLTRVPPAKATLAVLADKVGVVRVAGLRGDVLAWIGASLWANHWHVMDPEAECLQWQTVPKR